MAVIPARLSSSRLPRKPLADIGGRPMIVRVWEAVRRAQGLDRVVVATDAEEIAEAVREAGADVVMTSPDCPSGTDRVAEVARALPDATHLLNIQGDEPLLPPECVEALRDALLAGAGRGVELATLARPLKDDEAALPQVVKVVRGEDGTALYFSRSLVPYPRENIGLFALAHVGLYGYTRGALLKLAALAPTALEKTEGLEQLRALGHGMRMQVAVGNWQTHGVDTPDDLERARALWAGKQSSSQGRN